MRLLRLSESLGLLFVDIRSSSDLTSPLLSLGLPFVPLPQFAVRVAVISPPHRTRPHRRLDAEHGPEAGEPVILGSTCYTNISFHLLQMTDLISHTLAPSWILPRHVVVEAVSSLARQTVSLVRRSLELPLASLISPDPGDLTLPVLTRLASSARLSGHRGWLVQTLTLLPPGTLRDLRQWPL